MSRPISALTSAHAFPLMAARPMNIQLVPAGASPSFARSLNASRKRRFARLRSTAWRKLSLKQRRRPSGRRREPNIATQRGDVPLWNAPGRRQSCTSCRGAARTFEASNLRKALATLGAAAGKNLAATLRRLASAITDFPFPLDLRRLPCHLHVLIPFKSV